MNYSSLTTLGDTSEFKEGVSKYNTFCTLCSRRIESGTECRLTTGHKYVIHLDCTLHVNAIHKSVFLKEVKRKGKGTRSARANAPATQSHSNDSLRSKGK